jgi:Mce-associated membrane protein
VAAVGAALTLLFGILWLAGRGDDGAPAGTAQSGSTAEMLTAAKSFSLALTNFDGATVDRDFQKITAMATGEFRSQADQFFSTEIRTKLKAAQAASRGEVRSAFVQTADGDRGTVFVVVDQTIANNQSPQPQADTLRMELGLVRKGDRWLVERVSVLTAPAGSTAGSTGSTGGSTTPSGD